MSSHLGVNETLALLDRLKSAIQDFAAREGKLNDEFRARFAAETKAFESDREKQTSWLTESLADVEAAIEAEKDKWRSKFENRKTRINHAHTAACKQIREGIGGFERRIRENLTQAERDRDAELANAAVTWEDFNTKLAGSREVFEPLEKAVKSAFRGCGKFRRMISPRRRWPEPDLSPDEYQLLEELNRLPDPIRKKLDGFERFLLPQVFRFSPIWLLFIVLSLVFIASSVVSSQTGLDFTFHRGMSMGLAALFAASLVIYQFGKHQAGPIASAIARDLAKARRLHDACLEKAESRCLREQEQIRAKFENTTRSINRQWRQTTKRALDTRALRAEAVDEKAFNILQKNEQLHLAKNAGLERDHRKSVELPRQEADVRAKQLAGAHEAKMSKLNAEQQSRWQALQADWENCIRPIHETLRAAGTAAEELFPEWQQPVWKGRALPEEFKNVAKFGSMKVDITRLAEPAPKDKRLALPFPANFSVPMLLKCPEQGSILFETTKSGGADAIAAINNVIFRLLSAHPPGKLNFTIFDPVGLGQNFAGLMHLADYEESHINSRIWTQTNQLEEKLAPLL